jgi:hypothetical protein
MFPCFVGALVFTAAFAFWRWVVGDRNWLEGGVIAFIMGVLAGLCTHLYLRALATVAAKSAGGEG